MPTISDYINLLVYANGANSVAPQSYFEVPKRGARDSKNRVRRAIQSRKFHSLLVKFIGVSTSEISRDFRHVYF
jgi:hypothetical protein